MGRLLIAPLTALIVLSGCIRRDGMNFECLWPVERRYSIDLRNRTHTAHLLEDIEIAEELAIRHRDRLMGRRPVSIGGILVRTGFGREESNAEIAACPPQLFATIADVHGLTTDDVLSVRKTLNDKGPDLPVNLPMGGLYALLATCVIRRIRMRFDADERAAARVAVLIAAIMVSALIAVPGHLWAGIVEMIRVGNEHLSYRGSRLSWPEHRVQAFFLGVTLFSIVGLISIRRRKG